ncbi:MAG: hypothetical protein MJY47_04465 [Fibrobacter sp.]|nr:hypothetical protein [Fibrobacter sp.]
MNKMNRFLIAFAVASLVGCSSMDVDEDEAIAENFPEDFSAAEYMELHPQLVSLQIQDYVKNYNASVGLSKEQISADSAAFASDTSVLHKIFVNPIYGGYSEELWDDVWSPITRDSIGSCKTQMRYLYLNLDSLAADSTKSVVKVFSPVITYGADSAIVSVKGLATEGGKDSVNYTITETLKVAAKKGEAVTDTLSCDTIPVKEDGTLSNSEYKHMALFNAYGVKDDLSWLKKITLDTLSFSYHFSLVGKGNGWAYRKCKDEESSNPIQGTVTYPTETLYCVDDLDIVHEIK